MLKGKGERKELKETIPRVEAVRGEAEKVIRDQPQIRA
jgi:hypothetical protein